MPSLVRYAFFGLAFLANICGVQANDERTQLTNTTAVPITTTQSAIEVKNGIATTVSSTPASTATCPSRTINYITHTLVQQCLRADWSRSRSNSSSTATAESVNQQNDTITSSGISPDSQADLGTSSQTATNTLSTSSTSTTPPIETDVDADSPLDNANFLSFEEWKKQNLAKAGQSGDNLGARNIEHGRRPPNVNALDSLGEESEIELDFSGFGGASVKPETKHASSSGPSAIPDGTDVEQVSPASQALRPRDAGKTCKERTNYASFDCAATVLKSNQECKSASSVLVENKDSYMLNKCSANNKYFIVELCNDILIDTVVLANYEFFSSIFRTFRVSVSDRYPAKADKWKNLGTFEARNTREVQAFLIENPLIWARYLRIEFLTHYGSEYYCPVSLLRVHGTTMMEEFRNQEELARGESQDDDLLETSDAVSEVVVETATATSEIILDNKPESTGTANASFSVPDVPTPFSVDVVNDTLSEIGLAVKHILTTSPSVHPITQTQSTCPSDMSYTATQSRVKTVNIPSNAPSSLSTSGSTAKSSDTKQITATSAPSSAARDMSTATVSTDGASSSILKPSTAMSSAISSSTIPSISSSSTVDTPSLHNTTIKDATQKSSTTNSTKSATSSAQPQPSTQESFFKSISKRLQQLESNSTLSLQYIEEQSRILRDAFSKVEKRQISTTTSFLADLNNTVMAELVGFRQAYDQLWQSTVIELEGQREQHQREMTALSSRLTLVVDELVWQKRMGIVQSTLLLLCLGLVLFARQGNGTFEASLVQQVMARSQAAFRTGANSDQSSPTSLSPVSLLRRKIPLWRTERVVEEDECLSPDSPDDLTSLVEDSPLHEHESAFEVEDGASDVSFESGRPEEQIAFLEEASI